MDEKFNPFHFICIDYTCTKNVLGLEWPVRLYIRNVTCIWYEDWKSLKDKYPFVMSMFKIYKSGLYEFCDVVPLPWNLEKLDPFHRKGAGVLWP